MSVSPPIHNSERCSFMLLSRAIIWTSDELLKAEKELFKKLR